MVHESLNLYVTDNSYTIVPYYFDSKTLAQILVINRETGALSLSKALDPSLSTINAEAFTIYGIFGFIRLISGEHLIVITGRERIGRLGKHDVFQANQFRILPFTRNTFHLSESQVRDERNYLSLIENHLKSGTYYFSYTYDLTHSIQRQSQLGDLATKPIWQRADDRFFWNRYVQSKLIDFTIKNPDQDLSKFILPIIFGFIAIYPSRINNRDIVFSLITRRSRFRAGTRFFSRGIDKYGNTSNYNETEQIVLLDPIKDGYNVTAFEGKIYLSYVQVRGSVPIYWAQINNLRYTPKLQIMDLPDMDESARKHFDEQIRLYGNQLIVNLVNKKGYEYPVGAAYQKVVTGLNNPRIKYYHFDFHHECRNMRWDRIQLLIESMEEDLLQQGYFHGEETNSTISVYKNQASVIRTNCMDCLDRTNVVQSTFAKWMLTQQLRELGVLSSKQSIDEISGFMDLFRNVWADNANAVSLPYAGTGAQKTDYTRTGKRTKSGAAIDLQNGILRYILNNFMDGTKQDAYDLFLGNYEVKPDCSPFTSEAPQALLGCLICMLFLLIIPKYEGYYLYIFRFFILFNLIVIVGLVRFILDNGAEFVNWPNLVPIENKYYLNKLSSSSITNKYLKSRLVDTEFGEKIELQKIEYNNTTGAGGNGNNGGGGISSSSNNNNSASKNGNITNSTDVLPKRLTKGKEPGKEVPVLDFNTFDISVLRRYKRIHKLKVRDYATKEELVAAVTRHYATQTVKEVDMIASFIYAVQNKNNTLKLPIP
nr:11956_t:CDS:10 [Entrophospora candida]